MTTAPDYYRHAEAFCLMTYRADDGTEEEVIWNSRDGVTPFVIDLRSGKPAIHVGWHLDRCVPDYVPPSGSRIFVDLTEDTARQRARRAAERWFADDSSLGQQARAQFRTVEEMTDALAAKYRPGDPDIQEV
jgi:hypothetical protein